MDPVLKFFKLTENSKNIQSTKNGATRVISAKNAPHHNNKPIPLIIAMVVERTPPRANIGLERSQSIETLEKIF